MGSLETLTWSRDVSRQYFHCLGLILLPRPGVLPILGDCSIIWNRFRFTWQIERTFPLYLKRVSLWVWIRVQLIECSHPWSCSCSWSSHCIQTPSVDEAKCCQQSTDAVACLLHSASGFVYNMMAATELNLVLVCRQGEVTGALGVSYPSLPQDHHPWDTCKTGKKFLGNPKFTQHSSWYCQNVPKAADLIAKFQNFVEGQAPRPLYWEGT